MICSILLEANIAVEQEVIVVAIYDCVFYISTLLMNTSTGSIETTLL